MSPDTVEARFKEMEADINHLKVHGLSAVVIIKILEALIDVVRTLAVHTAAARIK